MKFKVIVAAVGVPLATACPMLVSPVDALGGTVVSVGACGINAQSYLQSGSIYASTQRGAGYSACTSYGARARNGSTYSTWSWSSTYAVASVTNTSATPDGGNHLGCVSAGCGGQVNT
jgi:hypothetical protein